MQGQATTATAAVFHNRSLRRVVSAYGLFIASEYGAWICVLVWAYERGGSREAGAIALAQLVPAAVAAPLLASIADRRSPGALLIGGYLVQAAALGATALAVAAGDPVLVWLFAVVAATAVTAARPAQAVLIPAVVERVEGLGAANSTIGWIESGGIVFAGVVSGVLLSEFGVSAGIGAAAAFAFGAALSAFIVRGVRRMAADGESISLRATFAGGVAAVRESSAARVLLGLQAAAWVVVGALDILFVVLAIQILEQGVGWVGYLNTAYGLGGVVAGVVAGSLVAVRRLSAPIFLGAGMLSAALGALAFVSSTIIVPVVLVACVGAGRLIFDVSARTLLQRIVPAHVIGRVFGIVEGVSMAGYALGSVTAPLLVWSFGAKGAFAGAALILPLAAVVCGRRLLALDRAAHVPVVEIGLLRGLPAFRWLPGPALETAARALVPLELAVGDILIEENDPVADHFYVIASGELDVIRHGTEVARVGRGSGVGEIALLRSIPRTASVVAREDSLVYALDRESFLVAAMGHAATASEVGSLADSRLTERSVLDVAADAE